MACEDSGMLDDLLNRPAGDLRMVGSDGTEDDDAGSDDDQDGDDEDDEDGDGDDADDKSKKKPAKAKTKTAAEVAAMERRIANFDEERDRDKRKLSKAADDLKAANTEITRLKKEGVKDEDVKNRNTELESTNARLLAENDSLRIQIAFLGDTTHEWVDPSAAVKLLDLGNVEIDDKGRVTGLKAAIDDLADKSKFLIKQPQSNDTDDDADGDDKGGRQTQRRKTGEQPGSQRQKSSRSQQARDDKLRNRFPGLRGTR
jgi:hypothetical protein